MHNASIMIVYGILFFILLATWLICSGMFSAFFIVSGVVSCILALLIARRMGVVHVDHWPLYIRARSIAYFLWLGWQTLLSALNVSAKIWQVDMKISPVLAWIPSRQKTALGQTVLANSITLTPGTVSVEVVDGMQRVHALEAEGVDELKQGIMDKKVEALI